MSYDLEILGKIESGDYICIDEPENSSPTYNLGKMFRVAMDWDFKQGFKIIERLYFRTRYRYKILIYEVVT